MKAAKPLAIIFGILTILGLVYVIISGEQSNAVYGAIPMVLCLVFASLINRKPKRK